MFGDAKALFDGLRSYGFLIMALAGVGHAAWWFYAHRQKLSFASFMREIVSLVLVLGGIFWFFYGGFGIMNKVLYPDTNIYRHSPEETRLVAISIGGCVLAFVLAGAWRFCTRKCGVENKA